MIAKGHPPPASRLGLCADCQHARLIISAKNSTFIQCHLSFTDSSFAKYPRLPVLNCSGYRKTTEPQ
jgi:hypothetical protein